MSLETYSPVCASSPTRPIRFALRILHLKRTARAGGVGWGGVGLVVVLQTRCKDEMFIHDAARMHLIMGAVSLWTRPQKGGGGGGGGWDLVYDVCVSPITPTKHAPNSGGRTPGSKLPASPPPLLRPDGGG